MADPESRAKSLFSHDQTSFLRLLDHLFPSSAAAARLLLPDARLLLDAALTHFPDALVNSLTNHLQQTYCDTTRFRCAILLLRSFRRPLFRRLSPHIQKDLQTLLLLRIRIEPDRPTYRALTRTTSDVATLLLPANEWPELLDYMFASLRAKNPRDIECACLLFTYLIPRCPHLFYLHVNQLSDAFLRIMDMYWGNSMAVLKAMLAGIGAAVEFILHLTMPSNHHRHHDLLNYIVRVLVDALDEVDVTVSEKIIAEMIVVAGAETRILRTEIQFLVENLFSVAENSLSTYKIKKLVVEFVVTVAEDRGYGCAMILNLPTELLQRLFNLLLQMLALVDSEYCTYGMEAFYRLGKALGENITRPVISLELLQDSEWKRRHATITALGIIADAGTKGSIPFYETILTKLELLLNDLHPHVRWATIQAVGQFSKNWGPHCNGQFYEIFLPCVVTAMEDFGDPVLQTIATSTMIPFSKNCSSDMFNPYLRRILSILCMFLQQENSELKEAALTSLTSLADSFQEEYQESYIAVLSYLKVNLVFSLSSDLFAAKSLQCMTMIGVAVGKTRFMPYVDKVVETLKIFLGTFSDTDDPHDPIRCPVLQAWGGLCKCLGTEFAPYLIVCMPKLLRSVQLSNYLKISENSDGMGNKDEESLVQAISRSNNIEIRSSVLDEKAIACNVLCSFAEELDAEIHLWIKEILNCFLPLLAFQFDDRVRTAAISAMPLILQSSSSAMKKSHSLKGDISVKQLSDIIIPALLNVLRKESKIEIKVKIWEVLNKCIKISGSCLDISIANHLVKGIAQFLWACFYTKTDRRRRINMGLYQMNKGLLKEEMQQDENIYKAIADCLRNIFQILKASFLPIFDTLLPGLALMRGQHSDEERRIFLQIFRDVAEQCKEEAFEYYGDRLCKLLLSCDLKNPDLWEMVAYGIKLFTEFGGEAFKPHCKDAASALEKILRYPQAKESVNKVACQTAVVALGKMFQFHSSGPSAYQAVKLWLDFLPVEYDFAEAKLTHDYLCTMIEKSEKKVFGECPEYHDFYIIIEVFAKIMSAGNNLATEDTVNRMKKILKTFQNKLVPSDIEFICLSLPLSLQAILRSVFSS